MGLHKNIYLIRHGETLANVKRIIQGQSGKTHLTLNGKSQLSSVIFFLKQHIISKTKIWASNQDRCIESAKRISNELGTEYPTFLPQLNQRHWGKIEGNTYDEMVTKLI